MINIHQIQRQRSRLYKNDLKRQFQQRQQLKKNASVELRSQQYEDLKQRIQISKKEMQFQKERQNYIKNKIKQENMMLATIKNMHKQVQYKNNSTSPLKGSSLMENLYQDEDKRNQQIKQTTRKFDQYNHHKDNAHRMTNKDVKSHQLIEDQKHMERLRELQTLRRQQNQDIRNRHSIEAKSAFQKYKKLQQMNDEYRKSLQSFAYNGKDILDSLKRDERKEILQRSRRVQSQLKMQIQEKKVKDHIQKIQHNGQADDLKKSILSKVLFKQDHTNKKQYAQYLMKQMNQSDLRRSTERLQNKQKFNISSIFGGQGGPQRIKMLKYIDQNLGIQSQLLKNIEPGDKSNSPYRVKNLYEYNGENAAKNKINFERNSLINPQKVYTQAASIKNDDLSPSKLRNNYDLQNQNSSLGVRQQTPKSYISYDLIKGSQKRYQF